ncbi:MAG: PEP-CTERM sorting domain-containing protein [Proteobacteria bacterium]|nr:PEP-CTERM sorting domain-containing protein [Pseudomonadota bacterium]
MKLHGCLVAFAATALLVGNAGAAVIAGPTINLTGTWNASGLEFTALQDATLTGFVYRNQGGADVVVLSDAQGAVLDSVAIPAGAPSDTVSVNWALTAGDTYWLVQTGSGNGDFAYYGSALPSDADISVQFSGSFGTSLSDVVSKSSDASYAIGSNRFWADFNNITTTAGVAGAPEPATWAILILGFGMIGAAARRRTWSAARAAGSRP